MREYKKYLIIIFICCFCGCELLEDDTSISNLNYHELEKESIPPCLSYSGINAEFIMRNDIDYDSIKIAHAPQGEYEEFIADGIKKNFKLSYQPIDSDFDSKIGPADLAIYVQGEPIYVIYNGEKTKVNSYPFYIDHEKILIFNDTTHIVEKTIPYQLVFDVDSKNGEILFVSPPPSGSIINICALS